MKIKKNTILLIFSITCLILSSWFYFTSPQEGENKQIEVILSLNNRKWQVDRLKAGIEQAAKELDTDILYRELEKDEEKSPLTFSKNSDGVMTYGLPIRKKEREKTPPVVDLATLPFEKDKTNNVEYQRGKTLGKYLKVGFSDANPILYWQDNKTLDEKNRRTGLEKSLSQVKLQVVSGGLEKVEGEVKRHPKEESIILVVDNFQQMNQLLDNSSLVSYKNLKCFLLEFSDKVLPLIDDEKVQGAVIQDDYSIGYQGVYQLMGPKNLKNRLISSDRILTKENLFSKELEPLVFPHNE